MSDNEKELLETLRKIRSVCRSHSKCTDCPLSLSDEGCILKSRYPEDWILSDERKTWNAFNPNYQKNTSPQTIKQSTEK